MATRYTAQPQTRFGVPGLPTGYQSKSAPDDFTIPSVGIKDVDATLFKLFNEEIPFAVESNGTLKRPPVVFFAGEKFALNKTLRALRDRNNSLILPLITAVRTTIVQEAQSDIAGRGINQQTGEIIIHRRLDKSDRAYQNLINRLLLNHQKSLAVNPAHADAGQLTTLREIGDMAEDGVVKQGGLLMPDRKNNIIETIVVPAPQFFTAKYEFTIWTQYTTHMTQLLEQLMSSQLPQGNAWRLDSDKGYWFVAKVDENTYTADTNTDDFSKTERIVKYKFTINVPGYILASNVPGAPVPIKRYVSTPIITFSTDSSQNVGLRGDQVDDPFLGADDPTLPMDPGDDAPSRRRDQRKTNGTRLFPPTDPASPEDPAVKKLPRGVAPARFQKIVGRDSNGRIVTQYARVKNVNQATGEMVLAPDTSLDGLTIVISDD